MEFDKSKATRKWHYNTGTGDERINYEIWETEDGKSFSVESKRISLFETAELIEGSVSEFIAEKQKT